MHIRMCVLVSLSMRAIKQCIKFLSQSTKLFRSMRAFQKLPLLLWPKHQCVCIYMCVDVYISGCVVARSKVNSCVGIFTYLPNVFFINVNTHTYMNIFVCLACVHMCVCKFHIFHINPFAHTTATAPNLQLCNICASEIKVLRTEM